ncbi:MAG TPA: hypothetical protein EYH58_02935 [Aquifex aeolicus]|nr:hypothetical protein [Aquifex aeolicus]
MERQVRGLILKFLDKVYPSTLTVDFILALLYDWNIVIDRRSLMKNVVFLINKGYIEAEDVELPSHIDKVKKLRITPKGKALMSKELLDPDIDTGV